MSPNQRPNDTLSSKYFTKIYSVSHSTITPGHGSRLTPFHFRVISHAIPSCDVNVKTWIGWYNKRALHDDVIRWRHFPRNWPFVRGIHRSRWIPHTKASDAELWCFSLICVWINGWVNNRQAGDVRRYRGHYDVIVMNLTYQPFPLLSYLPWLCDWSVCTIIWCLGSIYISGKLGFVSFITVQSYDVRK